MSSSTIRLIACRAYAFLFGIFGVCLMLGGLVGLYLSAYGAPPELRDALARAHLQESGAMLLFIIGAATIVFGALHAVVGFFASKGHVWPLITGTVCWLLIFGPSLWGSHPGARMNSIVLLGTSVPLTVLAVVARMILPRPRSF